METASADSFAALADACKAEADAKAPPAETCKAEVEVYARGGKWLALSGAWKAVTPEPESSSAKVAAALETAAEWDATKASFSASWASAAVARPSSAAPGSSAQKSSTPL